MPTFQSDASAVALTGEYNYAGGTILIPTGNTVQEFAETDGSLVWIQPSGKFAVYFAASGWMISPGGTGTPPADAIMLESILWADLGAGTTSGNSPDSVVTNPSGQTTGTITVPIDGYVMVSGNNTWGFADNDTGRIYGWDEFDFRNTAPWERTMLVVLKTRTVSTSDRMICGYATSSTATNQWGLLSDGFGGTAYFGMRFGATEVRTTFSMSANPNTPMALFCTASGTKSGNNSVASGALHVGVDTYSENFANKSTTFTATHQGGIGDFSSDEAAAMDVLAFVVWDKALTTAERQDVVDYYSNERGFDVI